MSRGDSLHKIIALYDALYSLSERLLFTYYVLVGRKNCFHNAAQRQRKNARKSYAVVFQAEEI